MITKILVIAFFAFISIVLVRAYTNIKITDAELYFINESFIDKSKYSSDLKPYNDTYTAMYLRWPIIKDFPNDTILKTDIDRIGKNGETERLGTVVISICDLKDKNREYLPKFLEQLTADGNCVKEGDYEFDDAGQVPIEKLFSESDIDGYKFKAYNYILTSTEGEIKAVEFDSEAV